MCPPEIFPAKPPASPSMSFADASDAVFFQVAFTAKPPTSPVTFECSIVETTTFNASSTLLIPIDLPSTLKPFPTEAAEPISIYPIYPPAYLAPVTAYVLLFSS